MDLKLKGKLWAGNIFHQFESICHDVDDFMKKDTVKFVENQVQSVGVSVQRLYSDAVEDICPHSGNTVKHKVQMVDDRKASTVDFMNSITNTRPKPTGVDEKQISEHQSSIDTIKNSDASLVMELDHVMQVSRTTGSDPSQESESYLSLDEDDDSMVSNGTGHSSEENSTTDLVALTACSNSSECVSSEISNQDHKSFTLIMDAAPAFSSCEVGMEDEGHKDSEQNMAASERVHLNINKDTVPDYNNFSEEMACLSDSFISGCACTIKSNLEMGSENRNLLAASTTSDEKVNECGCAGIIAGSLENSDKSRNLAAVSMPCGDKVDECESLLVDSLLPSSGNMDDKTSVNYVDNRSLSASPVMSTNKVDEGEGAGIDLPLFSTRNAADSSVGTDGTPCYSFSTRVKSSDESRSLQQPVVYFPDEKQKMTVMPFTCLTSPKSSGIIKSRPANFMDKPDIVCDHHVKGPVLSEAVSHESKPVDMLCTLSVPEPKGSPAQIYALAENTPLQTEIGDPNMETIDLSSDVKEEQESVILSGNLVHSFSLRRRNFRYYTKLIKDAFTSHKRLSKEYEHLAILYGDIDFGSSGRSCSSSAPAPAPEKYERSQLSQETSETEWELL